MQGQQQAQAGGLDYGTRTAPGQRQETRLAFWQRNNSILFSLCFAEAVAFVQATLLSCRRPEQKRQMQKEPEKRFGLACRRFYALAGGFPHRLLLYLIYIMLQKSIVLYDQLCYI